MSELQSGLIIEVPEAEPAVVELRLRLDRVAALGIPARVTALFPFVVPALIDADLLERIAVAIVAGRTEFPPGPSKRPDLNDVLFTARIIRNQDGTATLYTGMSDCEAGCANITDPFINFN